MDKELAGLNQAAMDAAILSASGADLLTAEAVRSFQARSQAVFQRAFAVENEYREFLFPTTDEEWRAAGRKAVSFRPRLQAIGGAKLNAAQAKQQVTSIAAAMTSIRKNSQLATEEVEHHRKSQATCKPDAKTSIRESVSKARRDAEFEFLLAADIPAQAQQCAVRTGECAQAGQAIKQLLVNGGIEEARTRIDAAKRQGCNVADLESEYSTYKDIRDAATYIYALNEACRFQDAVTWAKQLPGFASSAAIVAREMRQSNDGLAAKLRVDGYLQQAQLSAKNGNAAGADQNLRSAELEAGKFPCLMNQVNQVRVGLRLPVPKVEEIPTVSVNKPPPGALIGKPEVTKSYREDGGSGSYTERRYGSDFAEFEREIPWEKRKVKIRFDYDGVEPTLEPGKKYFITTTLHIEESEKDLACRNSVGSTVKVFGDVDVVSFPTVWCGNRTGITEFEVRKNARRVEIHLGGAPMGGSAIWKYGN